MPEIARPAAAAVDDVSPSAVELEAAVRGVRLGLAGLVALVVVAHDPIARSRPIAEVGVLVGLVIGVALCLNLASARLPPSRSSLWVLQVVDTLAIAGLAVTVEDLLGGSAWVLLVVPILVAAVRLGAGAVGVAWVLASVTQVVVIGGGADGAGGDVLHVPAALFVVALAVALLSRWLTEGWLLQRERSTSLDLRERRVVVLEGAAQRLAGLRPEATLVAAAEIAVELGFDAATVHPRGQRRPLLAVGDRGAVAEAGSISAPEPGAAVVTVWTEADEPRTNSVSVLEPRSGAVLTAWSTSPIGADRAETFLALVATTTGAVASAQLLGRLRREATRDPLTGLSNRHHFAAALERAAAADGRLAVGFVDVVGLRAVNEHHGHAVGDQALVSLARRLRSVVGTAGARYGGDRFVFLMADLPPDRAAARADALLAGLSLPIPLGVARLQVEVAVGLVTAVAPRSHDQLLRAADAATAQAVEAGNGRIVHVDLDPLLGAITSEDRLELSALPSARRSPARRPAR